MKNREVALIADASKWIGRFLAEPFVKKGAIVEGCSRKPDDWSLSGYTHSVAEVTNETQFREMSSSLRKSHGRLDIAVNNAGIPSLTHLMLIPAKTATDIIETNLFGTFLVRRESAKLMKRGRCGRIINFSTIAVPMLLDGEAI